MRKPALAVLATAVLLIGSAAHASDRNRPRQTDRARAQVYSDPAQPSLIGSCTMAVPATRATVEAQIANAADFCELVSQALAGDVFRGPVIVTTGELWHYAGAALSCRLRYGATRYGMTIHNSAAACRWLTRLGTGWRRAGEIASGTGRAARATAAAPGGNVIRVTLKPANSSHLSGTATLTHVGSGTRVVVVLNKPIAGRLPAHIHIGACRLDPNFNLKAGLKDVVNGRSVTILDPFPTWAELQRGALSIHIHQPGTLTMIACGDFPRRR